MKNVKRVWKLKGIMNVIDIPIIITTTITIIVVVIINWVLISCEEQYYYHPTLPVVAWGHFFWHCFKVQVYQKVNK